MRSVWPSLVKSLNEVIRSLAKPGPRGPPRILQLIDTLIREPVENQGNYTVIASEATHKLLRPLMVGTVKRWTRRNRIAELGLDSSSRSLETSMATIIVAGGALSAPGHYPLIEYPSLHSPTQKGPGFLAMIGIESPGEWPFITRNPAGHSYATYSPEQALDETRIMIENWMLETLAPLWVEHVQRRGAKPVVLVDGPIVPVTMAFQRGRNARSTPYIEAWHSLVESRVRAVRKLESMDALVVGVVKRIDKSTILSRISSRIPGLRDIVMEGMGDQGILHYCYNRLARSGKTRPGRVYVVPRLQVVISSAAGDPIVKNVEYLVSPIGWYTNDPARSHYYRLEYLGRTAELLDEMGAKAVYLLVASSLLRGSLDPVVIKASDWRSKQVTKALVGLLAGSVLRHGIPLTYSGEIEVSAL